MPTYPQQKILEQYRKLPEPLKEAMGSMDTADKMFAIGKKFGLSIEKIGFMVDEVGNIILGFERPSEFVNTLKNRLEIDRDKAQNIASEINHQLFFPLREALKSAHKIDLTEETFQKGESLPTKPPVPTTTEGSVGTPTLTKSSVGAASPQSQTPKPIMPPILPQPPTEPKIPDKNILIIAPKTPEQTPPPPSAGSPKIPPLDLRNQDNLSKEMPPVKSRPAVPDPYREPTE